MPTDQLRLNYSSSKTRRPRPITPLRSFSL